MGPSVFNAPKRSVRRYVQSGFNQTLMSIERLELTIHLDDLEWTITTEDCIREGIWRALAKHFETRQCPHNAELFANLYEIEQSLDHWQRYMGSIADFEWLAYEAACVAEEVKKP